MRLFSLFFILCLTLSLWRCNLMSEDDKDKETEDSQSEAQETGNQPDVLVPGDRRIPGSGCRKVQMSWDEETAYVPILSEAHRFMLQATFGPESSEMKRISDSGIEAWVDEQLSLGSAYDNPTDSHCTHLQRFMEIARAAQPALYPSDASFDSQANPRTKDYQIAAWLELSLHAQDQLRQRVAFALSELLVVSSYRTKLRFRGDSLAYYYDLLARYAFGSYRDLLQAVAYSVPMGIYLSHQGNKKFDENKKTHPDENFSREIMQLFTLGLWELNVDGSMKLDAAGQPIATYTQKDVEELARVMTGYDIPGNQRFGQQSRGNGEKWASAMEFTKDFHDYGEKVFLGETIPAEEPSDALPQDMKIALDRLFAHPNLGPHVARHLIQRMVTSNPSAGYVGRVAKVFNDNGKGDRGDLKAVVRALLLDDEARSEATRQLPKFGKAKEPILAFTHFLRAFRSRPLDGWKSEGGVSMKNTYAYRSPDANLFQGPLLAPTVFNFFSSDFIPSDSFFDQNKLVSPELQIQSDTMLIKYSNHINSLLWTNEKNRIVEAKGSVADFAKERKHTQANLIVSFDRELAVFENALDGDRNGDFVNLNDATKKAAAIDAILSHLSGKILGFSLSEAAKKAYRDHLLSINYGDNKSEALAIVRDAVRFMVTSASFMIQR